MYQPAWVIDGGISTKVEATKALQRAKKNNIVAIVATPHVVSGKHNINDILVYKQRIQELQKLANECNILVFKGYELFINNPLNNQLDKELFIPIEGTSYLLCEFDSRKKISTSSVEFEDMLHEIIVKDYTPIVAHIKRYFKSFIDIDRIRNAIEMGCIMQVNSTVKKLNYLPKYNDIT